MESRPSRRRRIGRSPPPRPPPPGDFDGARCVCGDDDDRISALGDDTLVEILARVRCTRAAARTSLLSRRWRDLWTRLPDLTFCGIAAGKVEAALARVPHPGALCLLDIRLESWDRGSCNTPDARAKSLLRAAARLSPEELVFVLPQEGCLVKPGRPVHLVLPCLRRATSIELDTRLLRVRPPPWSAGELPALERLSLSGKIVSIGSFLDICPRLRELRVTFRGVALGSLEAELAAIGARRGLALSLLGIEDVPAPVRGRPDRPLPTLLRATSLSPQELVFRHSCGHKGLDLPCFSRTTSIELNLYTAHLSKPPTGEFSALERLTLSYSSFFWLKTLVSLCPRLRVLRMINSISTDGTIRIRSASLQELVVTTRDDGTAGTGCHYIGILTPVLKQLKMKFWANKNLTVSISAPMLEKVSWCQMYLYTERADLVFGSWRLQQTNLETVESSSGQDNKCSLLHVLRLDMSADQCHLGGQLNFAQEMEKLPFTDFSALELHLTTRGHVFRAFVLRLLEMHHLQTTTRLKVVLVTKPSQVTHEACPKYCCHSDEQKNRGSQSILLTHLEEVEIDGFEGRDRDLDFLTHILRCTPMLKRMTVKLPPEHLISHGGCTTKIYNILLAYPSVTFYVYRHSGELVPHTCIQSA